MSSNVATTSITTADVDDQSNYEEERRILLNSVADSLSQVVRQMSRVNESMNGMVSNCKEVEQVASLWRESFRRSMTRATENETTEESAAASTEDSSSLSLRRELS